MNLGLYYRTLRHLRFSQLSGQVMMRVRQHLLNPSKVLAKVPDGWQWPDAGGEVEVPVPAPLQSPNDLSQGVFTFINQKADLGSPVDWSASEMPRLWSYNLHYFDWLWALLPNEKVEISKAEGGKQEDGDWLVTKNLVLDWIENHPPSKSAGGWEPYPISLRLMNWSLLFGVRYREKLASDPEVEQLLLESIARQVKWLEVNIETHIQANHLLENLVAFACVGSIFKGSAPQRILKKYLPKLESELNEQFLADGMHYERSPMYHLRMLWLLEVLQSFEIGESESIDVSDLLQRGRQVLAKLRHPDGEISLFNDAVTGIYPDAWISELPQNGAWALADAGYYGYRDVAGNYLAIDAGAVGPDYQPGHAHADYFSFELSLGGKRLITDTGIGTYDVGERRSYDRSTAAHSTVEVAGQNSVEVWGGFRVGRRVIPVVEKWVGTDSEIELRVSHDGYAHLPSRAVHRRRFKWIDEGLIIEDELVVKADDFAVSRLHFAPECEVEIVDNSVIVKNQGAEYRCWFDAHCQASIEEHPCCSEFGVSHDRSVLVMKHTLKSGSNKWAVRIEII